MVNYNSGNPKFGVVLYKRRIIGNREKTVKETLWFMTSHERTTQTRYLKSHYPEIFDSKNIEK